MSAPFELPVCLRLAAADVLVVGGGPVAEQRCRLLLDVGARITLVAPQVTPSIASWYAAQRLVHHPRPFRAHDLEGQRLVFSATGDEAVSAEVYSLARARGLLVNTADCPARCDFTVPSIGRRGPLVVAVSSSGLAPALAARLQRALVSQLGPEHSRWARVQGFLRARLPAGPTRMELFKRWVNGPIGERFLAGDRRAAFTAIRRELAARSSEGAA